MCDHSMDHARAAGFTVMQYDFAGSTNESAIALWARLGFEIVGRPPGAFRHSTRGLIDAVVMFRAL
jgi:ribosomal protein S18 acetylase RimI-like enzyme